MDEIEKIVKETKKYKLVDMNFISQEVERTKERKRMLNAKKLSLENALSNKKVVIPKKFKRIEDVVDEKNIDKFYYNLFFYGFVDWERYVGYLLKDTQNFCLKIELSLADWLDYEFKEELLITEEMANTVLKYDDILDEELKKAEEETEKSKEIFYNQFKEYSE